MKVDYRLQIGDVVTVDGEPWEWVSVRRGFEAKLRRPESPDDSMVMSMPELLRFAGTAQRSSTVALRPEGDDWPSDVRDMEKHLLEVFQGVPMSALNVGPRPQYDLSSTTQEQRIAAKIQELAGTSIQRSRKGLYELWRAYRSDGAAGLNARMHRQPIRKLAASKIDSRILESIDRLLEARRDLATSSRKHFAALVLRDLEAKHPGDQIAQVPQSTLLTYIAERDAGKYGFAKGSTRQSAANSPNRQFGSGEAHQLGERCEIDSTTLDVQVWNHKGQVFRPYLTVLLDVASRVPLAWAIHANAPTGYDHALLIARAIVGRKQVPGSEAALLAASATLPTALMKKVNSYLTDDSLAVPWIFPQAVALDAGADFRSAVFEAACKAFGITMIPVAPGDPTSKPHVERFFGSVSTTFATWLSGSTGNSVANRGRRDTPTLTLESVRMAFDTWVTKVYLNRPHKGLRMKHSPGRNWTPNQKYSQLFEVGPGVQLPFGREEFFALLPTAERMISDSGIDFRNRRYDSALLSDLRNRSLTGSTAGSKRARKFPVSYDPYNSACVWVRHPETATWIECWDTDLEAHTAWMSAETEVKLIQRFGTEQHDSSGEVQFLDDVEQREREDRRSRQGRRAKGAPEHSSAQLPSPLAHRAPVRVETAATATPPVDIASIDWSSTVYDISADKELHL